MSKVKKELSPIFSYQTEGEKKNILSLYNKLFGTAHEQYQTVVDELKRIKPGSIHKMYEQNRIAAIELATMVEDIYMIDRLGKDAIKSHIVTESSPLHSGMTTVMTDYVELREKYFGKEEVSEDDG